MIHQIYIPNWTPTPLNKLINVHWALAYKLKQSDMQMIGVYAHRAKIPKAEGKRSLELIITLGKGQRACDNDAYFKSLLDALVTLKLLKDDNRQWLELKPVKFDRAQEKAAMIILGDMYEG